MFKKVKFLLGIYFVLSFPVLGFVEEESSEYYYDYSDPVTIIYAAKRMIMNSDFEAMLEITALDQKTQTLETIESLKNNADLSNKIKEDAANILAFEILRGETFTNSGKEYAVVYTKWTIKLKVSDSAATSATTILPENDSGEVRTFSYVFVDYMLQKIDENWLIISQRNR